MILRHKTFNVNGIDYHVVQNYVKNPKADLVLLHGAGGNYREFIPFMRLLYREYNITAIDLPGFGGSEALKNFSIDVLVPDLNELINSLGYKNIVIGGHSLGGIIAFLLSDKNPQIKKVITFSSPIKSENISKAVLDQIKILSKLPKGTLITEALSLLKNSKAGSDIIRQFTENFIVGIKDLNNRFNYNFAGESITNVNIDASIDYCKFLLDFDITDIIKNSKISALCIFGQDDQTVLPSTYEYVKETNPAISHEILDSFDHGGILLKPEKVLEFWDKFI